MDERDFESETIESELEDECSSEENEASSHAMRQA